MKGKTRAVYVCQQCGATFAQFIGRCTQCESWNSIVAQTVSAPSPSATKQAILISLDAIPDDHLVRIPTGFTEFDQVLGGGIVPGAVMLLAGDPGIGKSTLLAQVAGKIPNTLYMTGEESPSQIKLRCTRLGIQENLLLLAETNVDAMCACIESNKPLLVIVDSIQTVTTPDLPGSAGSIGQVRESVARITRSAKTHNIPVFLVGHMTKEGTVAGPKTVEHMVDVTLLMEGDSANPQRLIRSLKNRFGPTNELGVLLMEEQGFRDEPQPTKSFLGEHSAGLPGAALVVIMEGNRPLLLELQALVVPTLLPVPRRVATGLDVNRLHVLLAVLTRHGGISFTNKDVYVNVVGGLTIRDPSTDLALVCAILSSLTQKPCDSLVALGEVGLLGEVRRVRQESVRTKEAGKLGFGKVITAKEVPTVGDVIRKVRS